MKRRSVIGGIMTTVFVLNMQAASGGFITWARGAVNMGKTVERIRVGTIYNLPVKDERKIVKTKTIVV